jgi:hypothetical protein
VFPVPAVKARIFFVASYHIRHENHRKRKQVIQQRRKKTHGREIYCSVKGVVATPLKMIMGTMI